MAITDCDQVYGPGAGSFHKLGIGGNPYPYGECTWYVWQYYHDLQNVDIPGTMGNAVEWVDSAHQHGWTVDMQPAVGKVVVWSDRKYPIYGHVAVVLQLTSGGFRVGEMNFKYYADQDPTVAGMVDCREVTDLDGVIGFLTPHGVQIGSNGQDPTSNLLAALTPGLSGIASSISQVGLYFEAEALTAELKLTSLAQIGGGLLITGAGGVLAAFTMAGRGDPVAGARTLPGRFRREVEAPPDPVPEPNWTAAERAWLAQREAMPQQRPLSAAGRRQMAQQRRVRRGVPSPASSQRAQLQQAVKEARAARAAAGNDARAWVRATVRLRRAEAKLRSV